MYMLVRTCRPRIGEEQMSSSQMHRTSKNSMDVDDRILGWVVFSWAINSVWKSRLCSTYNAAIFIVSVCVSNSQKPRTSGFPPHDSCKARQAGTVQAAFKADTASSSCKTIKQHSGERQRKPTEFFSRTPTIHS